MKIHHYKVAPESSFRKTIEIMKLLERKTLINDEFINFVHRQFKTNCFKCYAKLVHSYIVKNFRYKLDEFDEVIQAPYILLKSKIGDCDDFSLFAYCCLKILGQNPKYIVFGKVPGKFTHIAVMINGQILDGANKIFDDYHTILKKYNYYLYP